MLLRKLLRVAALRFRSIFKKETIDAELEVELDFHFEQLVRENLAWGMSPEAARAAAARTFGNSTALKEQCRDQRRVGWAHDFYQDIRYAARMLRNSPVFTSVAISSLALGIGANTAILAAMDRVFLGGLPFPDADRLVTIQTFALANPKQSESASVPNYLAWRQRSRAFETMGASISNQSDLASEDAGPPEWVRGQAVTASLFETLGTQPMLGRVFTTAEEETQNATPVIVLSYRLWQRRFESDPGVLNKIVRLDGARRKVIGVMPPEFQYPNEISEYWVPLKFSRFQLQGSERYFLVTAKIKPEVSVAQAQAEMDAVAAGLGSDLPGMHGGRGVRVHRLREYWFAWAQTPLVTLEGAVILMILIVCSNLATLLLARGSARRLEMATRMALGAGRGRLIRQLLTESILIALMGGVAGILLGQLGLKVFPQILPPPGAVRLLGVRVNGAVLALTFLCSILTGLVFGIAPAVTGFVAPLRLGRIAEQFAQRLRAALVTAQIGLALVLLMVSGLLINSLVRMTGAERNFNPRGVLTFEFRLPLRAYMKDAGLYRGLQVFEVSPPALTMQRIYARLRALPEAESAAGISPIPVNSLTVPVMNFTIEGRSAPLSAARFVITPNLFATIKTPFVRGRDIDEGDTASSDWVAIVNEAAATRFWPREDPIGKLITLDAASGERPRRIVGVVRNIPLRYLDRTADPIIYTSYQQQAERYRGPFANMFGQMTFLIRSADDPAHLARAARAAVAEVERGQPLPDILPMEYAVGASLRDWELYALVLGIFAFTATLLAAIGVYGVTAYSVSQRTREIGIRMALGAGVSDIAYLISRPALWIVGAGLALGVSGSLASARLIESQLWGVTPTDLPTIAGASLFLSSVALVACFIPARRATRIHSAEALRGDQPA
jgi:putative ABC transport system permease protein